MNQLSCFMALSLHIDDKTLATTQDILACGGIAYRLLLEAASAPSSHIHALETLLSLANDHINSVDYHLVQARWLRLYVDVSTVWAMTAIGSSRDAHIEAVKRLDMATIIAGGLGRTDLIEHMIGALQKGIPRIPRPTCTLINNPIPAQISTIPVLPIPPDLSEYIEQYSSQPFILRRYALWPALERWKSSDYLLDTVGEGRIVPVETGRAYVDEGWGQKIIPFRTFLHRAGYDVEPEPCDLPDVPIYLAQHALFKQFPQLNDDFAFPDYVWARDTDPMVNVWIGNSAHHPTSPAHTDPHYNCYTQVLGHKRVWIAPPGAAPHMYTYDTLFSNTSKVPVFDLELGDYPDFFHHVLPVAQEAVLSPGDMLVMPPNWWHAMKGEGIGPCWSISIWY